MLEVLPPRSPGHQVTLDGYLVPDVEVGQAPDGTWNVVLDGRFAIDGCSFEDLQKWIWLVANAQAIGAGYSCHGENSVTANPFKIRCMQLDSPRPPLKIV